MGKLLGFRQSTKQAERAKFYRLVQTVKDQDQLNSVLLEMRNPRHRQIMYDLMDPMIKFPHEYPAWVAGFDPDFKAVQS
jgi:hypothetical protein